MKYRFLPFGILLALCAFFCAGVQAQRDFRPGYVIRPVHDTVHGFLLYKSVNSSGNCTFRKSLNDEAVHYTPEMLEGFRFDDGRYFISREVKLENDVRKVFLEFLIQGVASIYFMKDGNEHYFIEKDGHLIELTENEKIVAGDNGYQVVRPEKYTGKLKSVMSDCPSIFERIDGIGLSHSSLIRLAKDYHERVCTDRECIVFERLRKHFRIRTGFYFGVTMNRIKFGANVGDPASITPTITTGNQLVSDYAHGGLIGMRLGFENIFSSFEHGSILLDIAVQHYGKYHLTEKGRYDYVTYKGVDYMLSYQQTIVYQTSIDAYLEIWAVRIPVTFNYTFLSGKIRPYVNIGLINMFVFSQNKDFRLERFTTEFNKSVPTWHIGATGSAGARFMFKNGHYLFTDLGYSYTTSTNTWPYLRFINNQFEVKVGFSL